MGDRRSAELRFYEALLFFHQKGEAMTIASIARYGGLEEVQVGAFVNAARARRMLINDSGRYRLTDRGQVIARSSARFWEQRRAQRR